MTETNISAESPLLPHVSELKLLYQFSNTMLSTISLNKLSHLILTALISGSSSLFERSMMYLSNERSGTLRGMLGVTADQPHLLTVVGGEDSLSSRWEISEEVMAQQRTASFCREVRASRIDISSCDCPVITTIITNQRTARFQSNDCRDCPSCTFLKQLGVTNNDFAAAPLVARDKVLGMLVVDNPLSRAPITEESLHFLQLFANQAGMAMENSILYTRIDDAHSNLKDARERLVHGERLAAIGEMAANLAHELKNPLVTIGGFAGRLLRTLPEEAREFHYADTIVKEVSRLEQMLADILAFSRKPTICFTSCDLATILDNCHESCTSALEDHGVSFSLTGFEVPLPIVGDAYQLQQVFINLILNACDAMQQGGALTISAYESAAGITPATISVQVKDTGGGIADEMLPHIFNPFFTTKQHGTGLGLAIVNRIVVNHRGRISVANDSQGAVFTVTLPRTSGIVVD